MFEYFKLLEHFQTSEKSGQNAQVTLKVPVSLPLKVQENIPNFPTVKMAFNQTSSEFDPVQTRFINEALDAHNRCRHKHGVPPLQHNKEISVIAQNYAQNLAKLKALKHSSKDSRVYRNEQMGENLAFAYDSTLNFYSGKGMFYELLIE